MVTKLVLGGALAAVLLVAVVAGGWWFFVREDNELATAPPEIPSGGVQPTGTADNGSASDPTSVSGGAMAFEVVTASSEAAYFADEELASLGVPSTAKGTTTVTGTFYLTDDGFALDDSTPSTFTVDLQALKSDQDRRDNRVQEALETATFATATFTVESITGVDASLAPEEEHAFQMTGTLDLHGVQKEVTWDVEARREGNVITALATTNFLFADFGIPVPNIGGFVSVQDDVTLQMQIIAQGA